MAWPINEALYIEFVPNRDCPPAVLLRESYREQGKVRKRTLANLSCLSSEVIEGLKTLLHGGVAVPRAAEVFSVERSLPHAHVAAVLGSARGCGAASWFGSAPKQLQPLLLAMLVARVIAPASKLATHRLLHDDTANSSLGRLLGVGQCSADDLYKALDWLHEAQPLIERRLARQHLVGSTLVLYDLTSTWLTGRCCELAARGHSRDGQRDDPQIVFGLICTAQGCPIAVEVFPGNTGDPATVAAAHKSLSNVERAFRSMKTVDLHVRPVFHYNAQRVRAHVFLCMLAYYVEWHMRERLKPMLFDDEYLDEASASRASPVVKAVRSEHAKAKDASKLADDGLPLHSFRTLLQDLATLAYNVTSTALNPAAKIVLTTRPTPLQQKAFSLLALNPACTQ